MKIDMITFHFVNNFGGALQAYALQRTLETECSCEAEVIDYRNGFITLTDFIRLFPVTPNLTEIGSGIRTMGNRFKRGRMFRSFREDFLHLSARKNGHLHLKLDPPKADVYICGSDQIWNPFLTFGVNGAYYLDFVRDGHPRIAYAPSFGRSSMPGFFKTQIRGHLQKLDAVSVREKTGAAFIKELTGQEVPRLIDPTLLLSAEEWERAAILADTQGDYILLYIMQADPHMYEYARRLKEKTGLRIIEISRYGYNPGFVDRTLVDVGPREFLGLHKNAAFVCTNSYHGFIFSLIFEKRLCLIPSRHFRTRIYNLADLLSIGITEPTHEDLKEIEYDKDKIKAVVETEKQRSVRWLKEQIMKASKIRE